MPPPASHPVSNPAATGPRRCNPLCLAAPTGRVTWRATAWSRPACWTGWRAGCWTPTCAPHWWGAWWRPPASWRPWPPPARRTNALPGPTPCAGISPRAARRCSGKGWWRRWRSHGPVCRPTPPTCCGPISRPPGRWPTRCWWCRVFRSIRWPRRSWCAGASVVCCCRWPRRMRRPTPWRCTPAGTPKTRPSAQLPAWWIR